LLYYYLYICIVAETDLMKFYDCSTAPSPARVRIYIAEKGLDIPVVAIDLANRQQHTAEFEKINIHRTVPVLELDDGSCLTSTSGIWHYLESQHPLPPLIGSNAIERGRVADLEWRVEQEGFMAVGESFRNKSKAFAKNALSGSVEHAQISGLVERGRVRTEHFFRWLDYTLSDRQFIAGDFFSIADITALCTVNFARWIKLQPDEELGALHRWYEAVSARDSVKSAL